MVIQTKFAPTGKVPPWATAPKKDAEINWDGAPLLYRANGKTGLFSVAGRDSGSKIFMHLLDYRWAQQARWGGEAEAWLDILFVNAERDVSILPLRSNAASRMAGWLKGLQSNPKNDYLPYAVWLSLEMLPTSVVVDEQEQSIYLPEVVGSDWVSITDFQAANDWIETFRPDDNDDCWQMPGSIE
jgi:hypothetical protein